MTVENEIHDKLWKLIMEEVDNHIAARKLLLHTSCKEKLGTWFDKSKAFSKQK
jgi:hypothetical protein